MLKLSQLFSSSGSMKATNLSFNEKRIELEDREN